MKEFWTYTLLRFGLFVVTYAVLAGLWVLVFGRDNQAFIWPFVAAALISSFLSLKYLQPQRERLAARVQARAEKVTARMDKIRAREDED
ncbi:MAG TPA: DUF4229 domain-containing protein [Marmoricola sp.]|nr:DUF4229 domain-containing protein [Marmoricola sp.]